MNPRRRRHNRQVRKERLRLELARQGFAAARAFIRKSPALQAVARVLAEWSLVTPRPYPGVPDSGLGNRLYPKPETLP